MLQLRQLYAQVGLADRIQELPDAPGTVASRPDKSGHHGCTPKVRWVTDSFTVNFFAVQQWLQCLSELVIRHGFQTDIAQSHCLPALFINWIFVGCFGLLPGSLWCRVFWHWFFFSAGVVIGNSSGEDGGLSEGREYVLQRLFCESLS